MKDQNITELTKNQTKQSGKSVEEVRDAKITWTNQWSYGGVGAFFLAVVLSAFTVLNVATAEAKPDEGDKAQSAIVVTSDGKVSCGTLAGDATSPGVALLGSNGQPLVEEGVSAIHLVSECPA